MVTIRQTPPNRRQHTIRKKYEENKFNIFHKIGFNGLIMADALDSIVRFIKLFRQSNLWTGKYDYNLIIV